MAMRRLKREGKLADQEESDEINACSIDVPFKVDGVEENGLSTLKTRHITIQRKLSLSVALQLVWAGAIRDPLSGRTYVYQASA